jgi:hypothetical protein
VNVDSTTSSTAHLYAYDTSHFQAWRTSSLDAVVGASSASLNTAEMSYNFEIMAKAANWRV